MRVWDGAWLDGLSLGVARDRQDAAVEACHAMRQEVHDAGWMRNLAKALPAKAFQGWRAAGWSDALCNLAFLLDARGLLRRRQLDVDAFFESCQELFFENQLLDDLFPSGEAEARGLQSRLKERIRALETQVVTQGLLLAPHLLPKTGCRAAMVVRREDDLECAVPAGRLPVGFGGAEVAWRGSKARLRMNGHLHLEGGSSLCLWPGDGCDDLEADWIQPTEVFDFTWISMGPALHFGRDRSARKVVRAPAEHLSRLAWALGVIEESWPWGFENLRRFTRQVIPVKADGVVSYSYRHRPRISFINMFHRNRLDLVDDLIHENAHHHLNAILARHELRRGDRHEALFYSPWRRSLRPIHGILHASFTFTMGARLFERLVHGGMAVGLTRAEVERARFRCLQEVSSVRYSLRDLELAARRLKWLSAKGSELVSALDAELRSVEKSSREWTTAVERGPWRSAWKQHVNELRRAREHYTLHPSLMRG